jgi:hypothetical protein
MNKLAIILVCWAMGLLALLGLSCVQVKLPPAPEIAVDSGVGVCTSSGCSCPASGMADRAYRFTHLTAIEPSNLASHLNPMWEAEIENHITNVIFVVVDAVEGEAAAEGEDDETPPFEAVRFAAGPGWREPSTPYLVDDDFSLEGYHFLDDPALQVGVTMGPVEGGYQCQVENTEPASLFFHLGPLDDPLMCGPTLEPANVTPIMDLAVDFTFNTDCSKIERGHMTGCIPMYAVERICMCMDASLCVKDGADPEYEFPALEGLESDEYNDELIEYCKAACGHKPAEERDPETEKTWISFGGLVSSMGIEPSCTVTSTDEPGILLEADFRAEEISGFDMTSMVEIDELFADPDE